MQSHLCHLFSFLSSAINTTKLIRRGFFFFHNSCSKLKGHLWLWPFRLSPREANGHIIRNKDTSQYMSFLDSPSCKASSCQHETPPYDIFSFQLWLSILSSAFLSCKYLIMKIKLQHMEPMGSIAPPQPFPNLGREKDMTEIAVCVILVF